MDNPGPAPLSAVATGRPRGVVADLLLLLGPLALGTLITGGSDAELAGGAVGLVVGFACVGLRAAEGKLWRRIRAAWLVLALVSVSVLLLWSNMAFGGLDWTLREFWAESWNVFLRQAVTLNLCMALPSALLGGVIARWIRRRR
jgi:hypothetical protein